MRFIKISVLLIAVIAITSCKKETNKSYIYDVNNVGVSQDGVAKPNVKSTVESTIQYQWIPFVQHEVSGVSFHVSY